MVSNVQLLLDGILSAARAVLVPEQDGVDFFELFTASKLLQPCDLSIDELEAGLVDLVAVGLGVGTVMGADIVTQEKTGLLFGAGLTGTGVSPDGMGVGVGVAGVSKLLPSQVTAAIPRLATICSALYWGGNGAAKVTSPSPAASAPVWEVRMAGPNLFPLVCTGRTLTLSVSLVLMPLICTVTDRTGSSPRVVHVAVILGRSLLDSESVSA